MSDLETAYNARFRDVLVPLAKYIEQHLSEIVSDLPRIDRVSARAKSPARFLSKAVKKDGEQNKYVEPLVQIQDQVGARITTFYITDVDTISERIERYLRPVESKEIIPDSEWEFGYFGKHYILLPPDDVIDPGWDRSLVPGFFELQIKTLFQHAWSEAHHDLGYKPMLGELSSADRRKLAFTSAQAWGADTTFDELFRRITRGG